MTLLLFNDDDGDDDVDATKGYKCHKSVTLILFHDDDDGDGDDETTNDIIATTL